MKYLPLFLFALSTTLSVAAPTSPSVPLGPVLTSLGAKFESNWQFKEPALLLKTDTALTEEAWREIEALSPQRLSANGKGIDDKALARFAKLPLEAFSTDGSLVTDNGLEALKEMKGLIAFSLSHALQVKGTGAAALANHPRITTVSIGGTGFGDAGMPALGSLKQLTKLSLNHDQVTDAGLASLANHASLESLMFSPQMTPRLTDASLKTVATLKALRELTINDTVLSYEGGLMLLKTLPNLQKLTLGKVGLSETDLARLKADLPHVVIKFEAASPEAVEKWRQQFEKTKADAGLKRS